MSGNPRDTNGGGGGDPPPQISCESLQFETQLTSPKDDVIEKISIGDLLDVTIVNQGEKTTVAVIASGEIAGGIASSRVQRLRECLENGYKYDAKVESIDEGQVRVKITPR